MATDPHDPIAPAEPPPAPLAPTRSQSVQRLQIGLVGLGSMMLLVGLANIILTNAQQNQAQVVPDAASTVAAEAGADEGSDPLVDAGVVPAMPDEDAADAADANGALQP